MIFVGVQIKHPHTDITSITTTELAVRDSLPSIPETDPSYVKDVIAAAPATRPGATSGLWAAALLAVGGLVSVALSLVPDAFYSLWSPARRDVATQPAVVQGARVTAAPAD